MFNRTRIKIHKLLMGNPKKRGFVNPYAIKEEISKKRVFVNPYDPANVKQTPFGGTKKPLSFPLVSECVNIIKRDIYRLKTPSMKIREMVKEQRNNREAYERFVELAKEGKK
jgi:hypothetical protein